MCHMFFLNVEFGNSFGFSRFTFRPSRVFHSRIFSYPSVDTDEHSTGSCPHFYKTFKMLWRILRADNIFVRFYFDTLQAAIKVHAVEIFHAPSALLSKFYKKLHTKLLASAVIFTKLSTKTLCFDAAMFHLSIEGYRNTRPHHSNCFLSMYKLHCKRKYRNQLIPKNFENLTGSLGSPSKARTEIICSHGDLRGV